MATAHQCGTGQGLVLVIGGTGKSHRIQYKKEEAMAKPHKHAGLRMLVTTKLADADIAQLAKKSAEGAAVKLPQWSTVRLEKAEPGFLEFSVRGPGGLVEQMVFALEAATEGGATKMQSAITRYKTSQSKSFGFIPTGPKKMLGLPAYRKWITNFTASIAEPLGPSTVTGSLPARGVHASVSAGASGAASTGPSPAASGVSFEPPQPTSAIAIQILMPARYARDP